MSTHTMGYSGAEEITRSAFKKRNVAKETHYETHNTVSQCQLI